MSVGMLFSSVVAFQSPPDDLVSFYSNTFGVPNDPLFLDIVVLGSDLAKTEQNGGRSCSVCIS